ncbi:T9SS type A sorting domain-containing protein [Seonamhaeicola maritimus]|uniref:T9SS type A sorting domain-containing protein n=1 Tax=Seonamhaeicola maritimus TaxID=2591822 RepID=A0A5C7GFN0_9FLAO|nr:T9SS type A sorting domain-containing protein [Seonamhaeicola maritimus]TXG36061.1 T9SS type A sorting domain-containing protein [Seonamhaeicola maritimus]
MKRITLLLLFVPFIGVTQVITNGTFDTDISEWKGQIGNTSDNSIITYDAVEGSAAAGALVLTTGAGTTYRAQTNNEAPTVAGNYVLKFMVKGAIGTQIQGARFQSGNAGGNTASGSTYTLTTTDWEEYTTILTGIETTNMNIRIIGKTANSTYKIDDVEFLQTFTENSFVTNPDFETGDLTNWLVEGPDITAGVILDATTNFTNVAQIDYTQNQSSNNNYLENDIYDFGKTISAATNVDVTLDAFATNANIDFQMVVRTYDASGVLVESLFSGKEKVSSASTWENITLTKALTQPFNKIQIRIRTLLGESGNKVAIDNVSGTLDYTLGSKNRLVKNNLFKLYPNPAQNVVSFKGSNVAVTRISVFDITGKQVFQSNKIIDSKVNISNLNTGVYVVKLEDENKNIGTKKLVISR